MPIHEEVLRAARRICAARGEQTFTPLEIIQVLPHLNERSVRTHVVSRCCTNAPKNHPHKWDYFRRIRRGVYEIRPPYREPVGRGASPSSREQKSPSTAASEPGTRYGGAEPPVLRDTIHAVVHHEQGVYVSECVEIAAVTQGRSLDELVHNLQEAIALHLEGEDLERMGVTPRPRLVITYELAAVPDAVEA